MAIAKIGLRDLIRKYSTAGPRYTSYPTAPQWGDLKDSSEYAKALASRGADTSDKALYVHIPFCEALCYYCGCNIQITKDHGRSRKYVDELLAELKAVAKSFGPRQTLSQVSWGGGTPTFLSLPEMQRLHLGTKELFDIAPSAEVSIEIDPRVTTKEQLAGLRELGFNRVSLGVQDFHSEVQKAVNRVQSREMTAEMVAYARSLGFRGINLDLIYGLPLQTLARFSDTIDQIIAIRPDRIALYNYAHLPSLRSHQKILEKYAMPEADERVEIFSMAFEKLTKAGYRAIGMDHFALEDDELYKAIATRSLYRNFMGYTVQRALDLIGVGASAIGEIGSGYYQNVRETKPYEDKVGATGFATFRGCRLTGEDERRKWVIQSLMCRFDLRPKEYEARFHEDFESHFAAEIPELEGFVKDGLLEIGPQGYSVTALGRLFVRNIAMVFDEYLKRSHPATYSRTV